MNFEELIKSEINKQINQGLGITEDLTKKINELHAAVDFLMKVIVVRQDEASKAAEMAPETLRRKARDGEVQSLSHDGSRLVFYSIKQMIELKPRIRGKRQRSKLLVKSFD
jgi:hypothetical protein